MLLDNQNQPNSGHRANRNKQSLTNRKVQVENLSAIETATEKGGGFGGDF